ncbi:Dihydrodipicolinate synthetase [Candidatus Sulfopaludibacter sp. SbA6]|nr:Dihydrodipicolinate synthetase [Candidatus Sulfopaludibacter sp. SbA6]
MPNRSLQGIVPALVTPFREDERIDYDAWQVLIDMQIAAGVDGVFAGGSQGEFFSLEMEERQVAMRFCRQAVARRVTLYVNVGCVTTRDTVKLARQAEEMGVDVVVAVTPWYLKPSPQELVEHYVEVCRAVRVPVMAYNYPLHGGVDLQPETLGRIAAQCENLVGVKDSGGNLEQSVAYRTCAPGRELAVFLGPDQLILAGLERGCAGAITGCINVAPKLFVDLYWAIREGRRAEAERLQALASEMVAAHALHTFPSIMKEAMRMAGMPAGVCRKPVGPVPESARQTVAALVAKLHAEGYLSKPPKTVAV